MTLNHPANTLSASEQEAMSPAAHKNGFESREAPKVRFTFSNARGTQVGTRYSMAAGPIISSIGGCVNRPSPTPQQISFYFLLCPPLEAIAVFIEKGIFFIIRRRGSKYWKDGLIFILFIYLVQGLTVLLESVKIALIDACYIYIFFVGWAFVLMIRIVITIAFGVWRNRYRLLLYSFFFLSLFELRKVCANQ